MKKIILFKIGSEVVLESHTELTLDEIDTIKWEIVTECECEFDDIDIDFEEYETNFSDIDVSINGLICWTDCYLLPYEGLTLPFEEGSNEHLDAIKKGNLIDFIKFV
jgi:hypothetical protein